MRKRKTTKNKVALSRIALPHLAGQAAIAYLVVLAFANCAAAQTAKKKAVAPHAVIAGTVFRDPGFAQPGSAVTLFLKGDPKGKKLQEAMSDARGEFAFRVPPGPATYIVHASLKGFRPTQQEIEIAGEEQVNATLLLVPESK
jgi:hypothetical protein